MKRRDFVKSLTALLAVPALPIRAVAVPAGAAAGASASLPPNLYTWSAMIARRNGACSAETLMTALKIERAQAVTMFNRLIANNVVGPANALGVSQARSVVSDIRIKDVLGEADTDDDAESVSAHDVEVCGEAPVVGDSDADADAPFEGDPAGHDTSETLC